MTRFDTNIIFPEEGLTVSCQVEDLGNAKYKLMEHPILATQAKYGDVIQATFISKEKLRFQKVIRASDFEMLDFLLSKRIYQSDKFQDLLKSLTDNNIFWQQDFGGVFSFFVKPDLVQKTKLLILSVCE